MIQVVEIAKYPETNPESSRAVRSGKVLCGFNCSQGFLFGGIMVYPRKDFITKEKLKDLYVNQIMSLKQIADIHNVNHQLVANRLEEYGIPARSRQHSNQWMTKELLEKMYLEKRMSFYEIGKHLGFSTRRIWQKCQDYGIKSRTRKKAALSGVDSPLWKGGYVSNANGYRVLRIDGKPAYEHRKIMEDHLGYKLKTNQHVHHINGDKLDNRIENLEVLDASVHFKERTHHRTKKWRELKREVKQTLTANNKLKAENEKLKFEIELLKESLEDMRCNAQTVVKH